MIEPNYFPLFCSFLAVRVYVGKHGTTEAKEYFARQTEAQNLRKAAEKSENDLRKQSTQKTRVQLLALLKVGQLKAICDFHSVPYSKAVRQEYVNALKDRPEIPLDVPIEAAGNLYLRCLTPSQLTCSFSAQRTAKRSLLTATLTLVSL